MSMIASLYEHFVQSKGVSTDTRSLKEGQMFFALNGPNFNANSFADKAIEEGARLAVVDDQDYVKDERYILVNDGLEALQQLAIHHRNSLDIPVIGITGSNGKTTTKELIRDVLAKKYRVSATRGNLNNHIGVPLTLLEIHDEIEIAIIEMGANHVGEIAALSEIARPTHGLITNIGKAHLEGFGGIEGVIRGKSELYNYLIQHEGRVFVNSQNEILSNMAKKRISDAVYYSAFGDYFNADLISSKPYIQYKSESGNRVQTQLAGEYNFENICAALCIGKFFGVKEEISNLAISEYMSDNNRSQLIQIGDLKIILDAYNANPTSMRAALENLALEEEKPKSLILGDMYELGETGPEEHRLLGQLTEEMAFDRVILCGKMMTDGLRGNPSSEYFGRKEELIQYLNENPIKEGVLLIKGSRGMGLETLLAHLA